RPRPERHALDDRRRTGTRWEGRALHFTEHLPGLLPVLCDIARLAGTAGHGGLVDEESQRVPSPVPRPGDPIGQVGTRWDTEVRYEEVPAHREPDRRSIYAVEDGRADAVAHRLGEQQPVPARRRLANALEEH